jgi:hypothetical protein
MFGLEATDGGITTIGRGAWAIGKRVPILVQPGHPIRGNSAAPAIIITVENGGHSER